MHARHACAPAFDGVELGGIDAIEFTKLVAARTVHDRAHPLEGSPVRVVVAAQDYATAAAVHHGRLGEAVGLGERLHHALLHQCLLHSTHLALLQHSTFSLC